MKLLKFIDGDAPQAAPDMAFDNSTNTLSLSPGCPKGWKGLESTGNNLGGCYWLVDENGKPVCAINEVVVMKSFQTAAGSAKGITDEHVAGVDFRNKIGKALETSRADYGVTFKKAAAKPTLMNQQERSEKRTEAQKRERESVADQIEKGETPLSSKSKKDNKKK